ncbi:MAG: AraC family transcriptional regulator [Bacteroidaceae bacterium]
MGQIKYLISNEHDLLWGLAATTIGLQNGQPGESYPYGSHPDNYLFSTKNGRILQEYTLVYIYKGSGWFWSTHCQKTPIKAGDVFLIFPGEWHNYAPNPETGWSEAWVGFKGEYMDRLVCHQFFDLEHPIVNVGVSAFLWEIFSDAFKVAISQEPAFQQHLAGYINLILSTIYVYRQKPHAYSPVTEQIVMAKNIMMENISKKLKMEEVAELVGMGYSMFRKEFKKHTGFSPGQFYSEYRMTKAKDLLLHTHMTAKEIAYELGFDTPSYFYEAFRQHEGMPPSAYRESLLK